MDVIEKFIGPWVVIPQNIKHPAVNHNLEQFKRCFGIAALIQMIKVFSESPILRIYLDPVLGKQLLLRINNL